MTSNATHKHLFYTEMAKLLEAGFDIRKAATVLADTKLPGPQAALLKDLHQGLESGQSITESFSKDAKSISELERNIIGAGERGGKLAPAFQHLADYFGMVASTRWEMIKGMLYPLLVLHMGIIVGSVPAALMRGGKSGAEIFGSLVLNLLIIYAIGFAIFLAIRAVLKLAPGNAGLDRLINRIPWIGKARRNMAMARFCKVYHSCILAGITISETAELAANASQSGAIREAGAHLVATAKAGNALGPEFLATEDFPKAFARSYATGEEAGSLDKDLGRWAKVFQDDAESSAKTASTMVPKVLYFIILLFIAWQIISVYSSYNERLDNIGNESYEE
jgi:type IV pilus assembly protein PilC